MDDRAPSPGPSEFTWFSPVPRSDAAGARAAWLPADPELVSRYRQAVACYAELCTTTRGAAAQLAAEGVSRGLRRARADGAARRLPWLPLLLTSVRETAAAWQEQGYGDLLDPGLRGWLIAEVSDEDAGVPRHRPLVLRAFEEMPEPERSLLWDAEVEAASADATARLFGMDAAAVGAEAARAREVLRVRCLRLHARDARTGVCRGYAKLLDAVTRRPDAAVPEDLRGHLSGCPECRQAADCLALHGDGLAGVLAAAVLGWGGAAYREARRGSASGTAADGGTAGAGRRLRHRWNGRGTPSVRRRVITAAVLTVVAALLLAALAAPANAPRTAAKAPAMAGAVPYPPSTVSATPSASAATSSAPGTTAASQPVMSAMTVRSSPPATASQPPTGNPYPCAVHYHLDNQWPNGFQADVTIASRQALAGWRLEFEFTGGQHITQMWNGSYAQDGPRVLVSAADYNATAAPGGSVQFGFLGSWQDGNPAPTGFVLNGYACRN